MVELVVWENTFQTYQEAAILSEERVDLDAFLDAQESKAISAMVQAFQSIRRHAFFDPDFAFVRREPFVIDELTQEERDCLRPDFWYVLRMSQICEADTLLGGGGAKFAQRRDQGILEEVIGETRIRYNETKPVDANQMIGQRTIELLSPYLYRAVRIGRA